MAWETIAALLVGARVITRHENAGMLVNPMTRLQESRKHAQHAPGRGVIEASTSG